MTDPVIEPAETEPENRPRSDEDAADIAVEVPAEDALEQRAAAVDTAADDDPVTRDTAEADPADLVEQSRAVELDEDEYR